MANTFECDLFLNFTEVFFAAIQGVLAADAAKGLFGFRPRHQMLGMKVGQFVVGD